MTSDKILRQIDAWRRDLIDFSRRNSLLHASSRGASVVLVQPDQAKIVTTLIEGRAWRIYRPDQVDAPDPSDEAWGGQLDLDQTTEERIDRPPAGDEVVAEQKDAAKLNAAIRTLRRRGEQEFLDKGLRILYVAAGALKWLDRGEEWVSPILLIPIELVRSPDGTNLIRSNDEEDVVVNPALIEKLRDSFDLEVDSTFDEESPQEVFARFQALARQHEGWVYEDRMRIGIYSFAKEVMYRDLTTNANAVAESSLVRALAFGSEAESDLAFERIEDQDLDEKYPPTALHSILDADSTQRKAIVAAKEGRSFVIDGPPGTGKSQTIANIIAELLASKKSVLFVSEKAAALEVVQNRLKASGLGSFVLPLHSQKVSRKDFATMLLKAANERTSAGKKLDASELTQLKSAQSKLSAYAAAMNEVREPLGMTLFDALGEHAKRFDAPMAPYPESITTNFDAGRYSEIREASGRLAQVWSVAETPDAVVWRGLRDAAKAESMLPQINISLDTVVRSLQRATSLAQAIAEDAELDAPLSFDELSKLVELGKTMAVRFDVPAKWLVPEHRSTLREDLDSFVERLKTFRHAESMLDETFPNWASLSDSLGSEVTESLGALGERANGLPVLEVVLGSLRGAIDELESMTSRLEAASEVAAQLEEKFGEKGAPLTFARAQTLAAAADLAASAHRPETLWFTATGIQAALDMIDLVRPVVDDYWKRLHALETLFQPDIRTFLVEPLFESGSVEPDLSAWSGAGRANRKALAPFTRAGKVTKEVREALVEVRQVQAIGRELEINDQRTAALGIFYYQGVDTDFAALQEAIDVARVALVTLSEADPTRLAEALGRAALDAAETAERGAALRSTMEEFRAVEERLLGTAEVDTTDFHSTIDHLRRIAAQWREIDEEFVPITEDAPEMPLRSALEVARLRTTVTISLAQFEELGDADRELLRALSHGTDSSEEELEQAWQWTEQVIAALPRPPSLRLAEHLLAVGVGSTAELGEVLDLTQRSISELLGFFDEQRAAELRADFDQDVESAVETATALADNLEEVSDLVEFEREVELLGDYGLTEVVSFAAWHQTPSSQLGDVIIRAVLAAWIEATFREDKRLRPLERKSRDALVEQFANIDRVLKLHAVAEVTASASAARPRTTIGPMGVIQKEAMKKSRHMRISDLLYRTKDIVLDIAPCFMMSPISASTFLPPDLTFDVVIFDEASQIMTSNAINCVYRGRQLIIAGDDKQMPPTDYFGFSGGDDETDEYDEADLDDFESLLNQANAGGLENLGLRWHYRSRHESLITYSNYSFYDGQLITYPSAAAISDQLGVSFTHVPDGIYLRGGRRSNPIEAARVVERVLFYADHQPEMTLGVVAFSVAQADEIENALELARANRPDLDDYFASDRLDGFFIKNLESVQGDERDIILFSVGYGRDEVGKLTMNFGPVNKSKGWRRLNVAFTRARCRVELISSITAADFSSSTNEGVNHLQRYFDYAERGISALAFDVGRTVGDAESPFEESVIQRIGSWGYEVDSQVGQAGFRIDMAVRDPDRPGAYVLGIECDGAAYHSSLVARDRDRLRQEVLEGLGWTLHRIWGPTWYRSRQSAESSLKAAIEAAMEHRHSAVVGSRSKRRVAGAGSISGETINVNTVEIELSAAPAWVGSYFNDGKRVAPKLVVDANNVVTVTQLDAFMKQVVEREGPVDRSIIHRRVADELGRNKTKKIVRLVDERLDRMISLDELKYWRPSALSLPGQDVYRVRHPDPDDPVTKRDSRTYPLTELIGAVYNIVNEVGSIEVEELYDVVVKILFGYQRTTLQWKDRIDEVLEMGNGDWFELDDAVLRRLKQGRATS